MTASVFVGVSVDGFMARPNGDLDFLPEGGGEPHGYAEFIDSVDAIVLGRKSFEKVLTFQPWPYGDKRVVVLSSRRVDLSLAKGGKVEQMAGTPAEIMAQLAGERRRPPLHRRWHHHSEISARRVHSPSDHHARTCPHWRGSASIR
jgi:Dihydrofolate reductase